MKLSLTCFLISLTGLLQAEHAAAVTNAITRIDEVKALSGEEIRLGRAVRLRGVVTARICRLFIMQDGDSGIFVYPRLARDEGVWTGDDEVFGSLCPGTEVEITGVTRQGGFAPVVLPYAVTRFGKAPLPAAEPFNPGRFFRGMDDCRRVEVRGVVQGFWKRPPLGMVLVLDANPGRFMARLPLEAQEACEGLVEAEVQLRGVAMAAFNTRGELLMPSVFVNSLKDLTVERPRRNAPFDVPKVPLSEVGGYRSAFGGKFRLHVEGVVTYAERVPISFLDDAVWPYRSLQGVAPERGCMFFIHDGETGLRVQTRQPINLDPGDRVAVAGFVDRSRAVSGLSEALVRKLGQEKPPEPLRVSAEQIIEANELALYNGVMAEPGDFDGALVTCEATLTEDIRMDNGTRVLKLNKSGVSFKATLSGPRSVSLPALRTESELSLTGVVMLDLWHPNDLSTVMRPQVDLLLRSSDDVVVLRQPSWWTVPRLLAALAVLMLIMLAGAVWVWLLHRRMRETTSRLAQEMRGRREAALDFAVTLRERNRLAANLHDTLLQTLGGIGFQLAACQKSDATTRPQLDVARRMVSHASDELRNSVWTLRSLQVHGQHFESALEAIVERARGTGDAAVACRTVGEFEDLSEFVGGNLLLIIQEALLNAQKHAACGHVQVTVRREGEWVEVDVRDDGRGFEEADNPSDHADHFGIGVMRERAERLGGRLAIESRPGGGTVVRVTVLLRDYDADMGEAR
ncbi:MAG: sensor histidine kinase [Kiritimatiellia bacterium]|jgi:signal transduction histidine kinase|nr:sensor histidine kinase [Kiritimatiellia bacterium]